MLTLFRARAQKEGLSLFPYPGSGAPRPLRRVRRWSERRPGALQSRNWSLQFVPEVPHSQNRRLVPIFFLSLAFVHRRPAAGRHELPPVSDEAIMSSNLNATKPPEVTFTADDLNRTIDDYKGVSAAERASSSRVSDDVAANDPDCDHGELVARPPKHTRPADLMRQDDEAVGLYGYGPAIFRRVRRRPFHL